MFKQNQGAAPLCEALAGYKQRQILPFTVPGHKLGHGIDEYTRSILGQEPFANDIPLLGGLDDRRESNAVRHKAEQLAAELYDADLCYFSVNGSSLSVHAAMITVATPGETVLVPRNTHKSLIDSAIFAGVKIAFIEPEFDEQLDVEHAISAEKLEKTLEQRPDVKAVFVVNPTYYGMCSDLERLASVCHKKKVPLIVDEAWGPHFPFHPGLPKSGVQSGADLTITSIHKTLTGLGQASIILKKGNLIDEDRLEMAVKMFESTSPSSLLLCSIDASRREMALTGRERWEKTIQLSDYCREQLAKIPGVYIFGQELIGTHAIAANDPVKIVIDVSKRGITGFDLADILSNKHGIMLELSEERRVMGFLTTGDDRKSAEAFVGALTDAMSNAPQNGQDKVPKLPSLKELDTEEVVTARDALFHKTENVKLNDAVGRISAEIIAPYPPGVPRLLPGERITEAIVNYFQLGLKLGMYIDAVDPELKHIRVVDFS